MLTLQDLRVAVVGLSGFSAYLLPIIINNIKILNIEINNSKIYINYNIVKFCEVLIVNNYISD